MASLLENRLMKLLPFFCLFSFAITVYAQGGDQKQIHTADDFVAFLHSKHPIAIKIMSKCTPDEIKSLTQSITFNKGKFCGMSIKELNGKLAETDFTELWSAFGANPPDVLRDYQCVGRCFPVNGYVCYQDDCHQ